VSAEAHLPLVVTVARRYQALGSLPIKDLVQEGCLGVVRAVRQFDPGRGIRFSTFAVPAIRWAILRAQQRDRRWHRLEALEAGQVLAIASGTGEGAARHDVPVLLGLLTERERQIIEMRFGLRNGVEMKPKEIAAHFGLSRQWIEFVVARSLERMRGEGH
jgi:RNA polymerase sporulation-specific sigma factor